VSRRLAPLLSAPLSVEPIQDSLAVPAFNELLACCSTVERHFQMFGVVMFADAATSAVFLALGFSPDGLSHY
jgi:hypothetical protein